MSQTEMAPETRQLSAPCKCGSTTGVVIDKKMHLGLFCDGCNAYVQWVKKSTTGRQPIHQSTRRAIRLAAGNQCHYCLRYGDDDCGPDGRAWHIDHRHPVSDGGTNDPDNLVLACATCNLAKSDTPYREFIAEFSLERLAPFVLEDIHALLKWRVGSDEPERSSPLGRVYLMDTGLTPFLVSDLCEYHAHKVAEHVADMLRTLRSAAAIIERFATRAEAS